MHHTTGAPVDGATLDHGRQHPDVLRPRYRKSISPRPKRFVREAADRGAEVILPSELFEGIYFCTRQDPKWFETAHPVMEHPCVLRAARAREVAEGRHPDIVLREGRPALLQQHRDCRCRRRNPRRLSQEPYPRWPGLSGEVLFPARRHRLQDLEHEGRPDRRRHLLGPMVSRKRARHGSPRRRGPVLSDRHRIGALRSVPRHAPAMAARDAGPRRFEFRADRCGQSHRSRKTTTA